MNFPLLSVAALLLVAACSPRDDRRTGDTGMTGDAPGTMSSRDTAPSPPATGADAEAATTPAAILSQMNVANTTEIQLARMAAKKASSRDVKRIAEKLAVDHSKNREQVRALAQKLNAPLTPAAGGDVSAADSAAMPADLQGKTGTDFDRAFVQHEIQGHQSNIEKIESQLLPAAQDPQIKAYLQKTLTDMQAHLASLNEVEQKLGAGTGA